MRSKAFIMSLYLVDLKVFRGIYMENFNSDNYKENKNGYSHGVLGRSHSPALLFENLIWLTTKEAALYLRKSVNAIHTLVSRRQLRARKFRNRLYFKKEELDYLIETFQLKGG